MEWIFWPWDLLLLLMVNYFSSEKQSVKSGRGRVIHIPAAPYFWITNNKCDFGFATMKSLKKLHFLRRSKCFLKRVHKSISFFTSMKVLKCQEYYKNITPLTTTATYTSYKTKGSRWVKKTPLWLEHDWNMTFHNIFQNGKTPFQVLNV